MIIYCLLDMIRVPMYPQFDIFLSLSLAFVALLHFRFFSRFELFNRLYSQMRRHS